MAEEHFVINRLRSFRFAFRGAWLLLRHEPSIQVQCGIAILVTIAGFFFDITRTEWLFQWLSIGLVMGVEGINTAIEKIADFIHPEYHVNIGLIKDVSAGAVTFAAISAGIMGFIIYGPYVVDIFSQL